MATSPTSPSIDVHGDKGEWDEVFDVIKREAEAVAQFGSRVSLVMKADIRPGHSGERDAELDAKLVRPEAALEDPSENMG